ncbi:MAG: hypothetical protein H0W69_02560 [Gemmatimonadaceae bacterium]|nr:hypothetical protein [Gemmatimonadaceae bacterium]
MPQQWRKLGLLFEPDGTQEWMKTHASVPFAIHLKDDEFRILVSGRDAGGRSHTGWFDAEIGDAPKVLAVSSEPLLSPGPPGSFDADGAMVSWVAQSGGSDFYYYIGWNRGTDVPFRNALGVALSCGVGDAVVKRPGPIIDRSIHDPCFTASACVIPGEDKWRMWYLSCVAWETRGGVPTARYHIKYAESRDGISWVRNGVAAIDFADQTESAISRPSVVREHDLWRMWYSHRGDMYAIGYAESADGIVWNRMDDMAGIHASSEGWDSEMIEYPHVFAHRGKLFMLYNGNEFGRSGVGLAVLEK